MRHPQDASAASALDCDLLRGDGCLARGGTAGLLLRARPPGRRLSPATPDEDVEVWFRHLRRGRGLRAAFGLSFFVCDGTVITSVTGAALRFFLVWQPEPGGPLG